MIKGRIIGFWGSNLGIIFIIYRVMIYINVVEVGTILMGFFNMLYYVSMWFHILTELTQVILGYTKTFPPWVHVENDFSIFWTFSKRSHRPKNLLICVFGEFLNFFSKIKIWIFMLTNLILVSIG